MLACAYIQTDRSFRPGPFFLPASQLFHLSSNDRRYRNLPQMDGKAPTGCRMRSHILGQGQRPAESEPAANRQQYTNNQHHRHHHHHYPNPTHRPNDVYDRRNRSPHAPLPHPFRLHFSHHCHIITASVPCLSSDADPDAETSRSRHHSPPRHGAMALSVCLFGHADPGCLGYLSDLIGHIYLFLSSQWRCSSCCVFLSMCIVCAMDL